jgi:hypothetical protein
MTCTDGSGRWPLCLGFTRDVDGEVGGGGEDMKGEEDLEGVGQAAGAEGVSELTTIRGETMCRGFEKAAAAAAM